MLRPDAVASPWRVIFKNQGLRVESEYNATLQAPPTAYVLASLRLSAGPEAIVRSFPPRSLSFDAGD